MLGTVTFFRKKTLIYSVFIPGAAPAFPWGEEVGDVTFGQHSSPSAPREAVRPSGWGAGVLHSPGAQTLP